MDDYHSEEGASGDPCFYYEIPGGLLDKDVIEITGYFYGEKIVIEVLADKYVRDGENAALPLQFTLTNKGNWTAMTFSQTVPRQTQSGTAVPKENFEIRIIALDSAFEIYLNGSRLCIQKHLIPLPLVTHISIDGEAEFTGVEFKDLCSENDASIHSNTSLSEQNQFAMAPEATPGFTRLSENRRSSNRKPKSPILVPAHGSFRNKPALATTREEASLPLNAEIDQQPTIKSTVAAEPVQASSGPSVDALASNVTTPGKGSSLPTSGKRSTDSKHRSLREKLHLKKGSKTSVPDAVQEENQYGAGSLEDVWVEKGGRELSVDGTGAFVVTGATSVPNLSMQSEKEKRRFSLLRGSKKSRSISSPPDNANAKGEGKDKKKRHFGGIHIGKGSRKNAKGEKEPKSEKESKKKSALGKKHLESQKISDKGGAGASTIQVTERNVSAEYANPEPPSEKMKAPSVELANKKPKASTPTFSHTASRGSFMGPHPKGSYDLGEAQKSYEVKRGTYHKIQSDTELAMASRSTSRSSDSQNRSPRVGRDSRSRSRSASLTSTSSGASLEAGVDIAVVREESKTKKKSKSPKIKGESPVIAARLMDSSARVKNSIESLTYTDPTLDIPLHLTSAGGETIDVVKEEHKRKEMEGKIKGDSAEIADNFGVNRGMSGDYDTYTGKHTTVPLKLTQDDLLSTAEKSFMPIIGAQGSYNLETAPDTPAGTYQTRLDSSWEDEALLVHSSADAVQHSQPPEKDINVRESAVVAGTMGTKEKKNLLKGESAEIASNLVDEGRDRVHGNSSTGGIPLCGENGINVPWRLDETNRNAQPMPYSSVAKGRSHSMSSNSSDSLNALNTSGRLSTGGDFAVEPTHEDNAVHAAAPISTDANLYGSKSATLPASGGAGLETSGAGVSATLPATASVVVRSKDKDKKAKKGHEGEEKTRKRDRVSGFFRKIFKKGKKKKSTSQSEPEETGISEGVNTDPEMTEQRSSSQMSLDTDEYDDTAISITAKPSDTCRYASQLCGDEPTLKSSSLIETMCGGQTLTYPLQITAAHISIDVSRVEANHIASGPPIPTQRTESLDSWSSVSPGGSRRHYHRSSRHRAESVSSWSSISPGGTRRYRHRSTAFDSSETKPKQDSLSSPTRDLQVSTIMAEQQAPAYAVAPANGRDQSYDSYFSITKQDSGAVHAAKPRPSSAMSSNSSISGLYGRVVIVGQSSDFRTRIQSYRKAMEMPKKQKRPKGYDTDSSDSSISSIASDKLPPSVVKSRGGEYAIFDDAGETIFEKSPVKIEDVYANNSRY
ncbi:hypothetical protein ECG_02962 [Echinococcus granulosus]|uniref:Galectin carbohydrate recognition domain n=1 Tax=Echinococcus granulosus TaxID=6210 RepID=A0A068WJ01_ECHGR|nr:hypothetical protein ECG_02962 [Echinococcus granulosus]CDS20070.1 Galectin carbohydrate recognition domain [Echinococcus granulosus]